ncbi:hypothetical protein [Rhizobium sp. BK068]|uniref:hypothetical protein n=1 Tax=Rhizobium sp. BK068 TaxID=2512130 RepID=UPI00104F07BC|nr:hypothetical protein [Rhizobium sp. BK068]TCM74952.1 hypothetical protein EV291_11632 [Rhizobium sp. BK068]
MTETNPDQGEQDIDSKLGDYHRKRGLSFGAADVMCLGAYQTDLRAHRYSSALLSFLDANDQSPFDQFVFIVPQSDREIMQAYVAEMNSLVAVPKLRSKQSAKHGDWFRLIVVTDYRAASVLEAARSAPEESAIIVIDASVFRTEGRQYTTKPSMREDVWVQEIHDLCRELLNQPSGKHRYVLLDTGTFGPRRPNNIHLLASSKAVGVFTLGAPTSSESFLAENLDRWDEQLQNGEIGSILSDIGSAKLDPDEKLLLEIQIFHRANLHGEVLSRLKGFPLDANLPGIVFVKLAQLAADAGASFLAAKHLRIGIQGLDDTEALSLAAEVARSIGDEELEGMIVQRLQKLLPDHPGALQFMLKNHLGRVSSTLLPSSH